MMTKQMPEVTEDQRSAIRQEAAALYHAALLARGLDAPSRDRAMAHFYDRLEIIPRSGGPETRVRIGGGSMPFGAATIARLVKEAEAEAASLAAGPDPVDLAADQVVYAT